MTVNNNNNVFNPFGTSGVVLPTTQSTNGSHTIEKGKHLRKQKLASWRKTLPNIAKSNNNNNISSSSKTSTEDFSSSNTDMDLSLSCSEDLSSYDEHTALAPTRPSPTRSGSVRWSLSKSASFRGLGRRNHTPTRPAFSRSNSSRSIPSNPITRPNPPGRPEFSRSKSSRSIPSNPSTRPNPPGRPEFSRSKSSRSIPSNQITRPQNPPARPAFSRSKSSRSRPSNPITSSTPTCFPPQIQVVKRKPSNLLPIVEHSTPATTRPIEELDFKVMLAVSTSWSKIKQSSPNNDYSEILGEQIILKMMELDPRARSLLHLESIRAPSTRFVELSQQMIKFIDAIVGFVGPDMEEYQNDIIELGEKYHSRNGARIIDKALFPILPASTCAGLKYYLKDAFTDKDEEAWISVLGFVITTMESSEDIVYV